MRILRNLLLGRGKTTIGLYALQATRLIFPLLSLPVLTRRLDNESLAALFLAQAIGFWVALIIEYGFTVSAARAIASCSETAEVMRITAEVHSTRLLLLPGAILLPVGAGLLLPPLRGEATLLAMAYLYGAALGFVPNWFFIATEKVWGILGIEICARASGLVALFLLVSSPNDSSLALAILAAVNVAIAFPALLLLYRKVSWQRLTRSAARTGLRSGGMLFTARAVGSIYSNSNVLLLSFLVGPSVVAAYGVAERIYNAAKNALGPLAQSMLPFLTSTLKHEQGSRHRTRAVVLLTITGLLLSSLVVALSPTVVLHYVGPQHADAIPIVQVLGLAIIPVSIGTGLALSGFLPQGRDSQYLRLVTLGAVLNLGLAVFIVPRLSGIGMAAAVVGAETAVAVTSAIVLMRMSASDRELTELRPEVTP